MTSPGDAASSWPCGPALSAWSSSSSIVLDWGYPGLRETLRSVRQAPMHATGAGMCLAEAAAPAAIDALGKGHVLVFAWGLPSSGIPDTWSAREDRPGVNLLAELSPRAVAQVAMQIGAVRQPGDLVVVSLHWGGNWATISPLCTAPSRASSSPRLTPTSSTGTRRTTPSASRSSRVG